MPAANPRLNGEVIMGYQIAVFDYKIIPTNPIGGCHLRMVQGLCHEHDFTVFAVEFDNPCPEHIRFVRIPVPQRPLALLFLMYHLLTPLYAMAHRLRYGTCFNLRQIVESNLSFGDISYSQFCHRAYLRQHWQATHTRSLRGVLRWLDHRLHAFAEPWVYRRARRIIVPSQGLARELVKEYPFTKGKIHILPNPVNLEQFQPSQTFNRASFRRHLGLDTQDIVLVFVALGHFERKGLPLLLDALRRVNEPRLKLLVVGGETNLIAAYRARVSQMDLQNRVIFAGMQPDVRPYLWAADAFAFPSVYEVFPLVSLEAAASALPLIVTPLYGVEEFIRDGENGILLERTPEGIRRGIERFLALPLAARGAMGKQARLDMEQYGTERFVEGWRAFYKDQPLG
jgi:glycosyltransferase involved in cell wall biosynthesis